MKPIPQPITPGKKTGECPFRKMNGINEKVLGYLSKALLKKYGEQKPLRAVHTKTIGLVKAEFKVDDDLPPHLRVGIFKTPQQYDAWIRFTNAGPDLGPDAKKGVRGMAIKILNITNAYNAGGNTQDIILITSSTYVPGKAAWLPDAVKVVFGNLPEKIIAFAKILFVNIPGTIRFIRARQFITPNILEEMYYSATPYSFGIAETIKWHVRPLKTITSIMPRKPGKDFLRKRLISDLLHPKEEIAFALFVQFSKNKKTEPIDDATVVWKTPFERVATIRLLTKQHIDTPDRAKEDEEMSFSPGNSMPEFEPRGSVNEVRTYVYEQLAKERREHVKR